MRVFTIATLYTEDIDHVTCASGLYKYEVADMDNCGKKAESTAGRLSGLRPAAGYRSPRTPDCLGR